MAVKRRIIWMNDTDWSVLVKVAQDKGVSISVIVRDLASEAFAKSPDVQAIAARLRAS